MELIWIIAECPYPPNSGGRLVTWNRLKTLSKENSIHLFCSVDSKDDETYKDEIKKICKSVHFYKRRKNFFSFVKSIFFPFPAVSRWSKEMKSDVEDLYRRKKIDWILVDFPQMMGNVPSQLYKKTILNQHNIEYKAFASISQTNSNLLKKLLFKLTAFQMKRYEEGLYKKNNIACYTFVSSEEKKYFEKKYNCKNTILSPIGINCQKTNHKTNNEISIIFVGKMSYNPNVEAVKWFVYKVWHLVKEKIPTAKFYIIGKDPSASLLNLAKEDKSIVITGKVKSVIEYYDQASVVAIPIISGGGVNVKVLEALGNGKLVVTTSKGIEGTNFISGKHLLVANTPNEFANNIINAIKNPNNQIAESAFQYCKSYYSWERVCKSLADFISHSNTILPNIEKGIT